MKKTNPVVTLPVPSSIERLNESNITQEILNTTVTGQTGFEETLTVQDQVIIGALATVATLSILAVALRICMPMIRKNRNTVIHTECKYTEQIVCKEKKYGQLPYNASSSSSSSSWSSNSQLDLSDTGSLNTKSTYYTSGSKNTSLPSLYSNFRGSTTSLPLTTNSDERANRSRASSYLKYITDDPVYILSRKNCSMEPLSLDNTYRSRWDEEFDPHHLTPPGSLSSFSHPSEDRSIKDKPILNQVQRNLQTGHQDHQQCFLKGSDRTSNYIEQ